MKQLRNMRFSAKLLLLVGVFMLTLAALLATSAHLTRERMIGDQIGKLRALVETTHDLAKALEVDVAEGRITRPQAIDRFRMFVYAMRYNGTDYLFAYDFDGTVLVLGNDPKVQGQNRFGLRDVRGKLLIQEMLATARVGGGTVDYWYPRKPGEPPLAKLVYVKPFVPWNMFIGTGVYIDDIDAAFQSYLLHLGLVLLGAVVVAGGVAFWIGRNVTASMSSNSAPTRPTRRRRPCESCRSDRPWRRGGRNGAGVGGGAQGSRPGRSVRRRARGRTPARGR